MFLNIVNIRMYRPHGMATTSTARLLQLGLIALAGLTIVLVAMIQIHAMIQTGAHRDGGDLFDGYREDPDSLKQEEAHDKNDADWHHQQNHPERHVSGVSGRLFSGYQIRNYTGRVWFSGLNQTQWQLLETSASFMQTPTVRDGSLRDPWTLNRTLSPAKTICRHWGVLTTIHEPTDAVDTLLRLKKWCVCVVADRKTPVDSWMAYLQQLDEDADTAVSRDKIVFLDVEIQEALEAQVDSELGRLVRMLPWNHFGRKNLGYIYAIWRGAASIWDFDDDNVLTPGTVELGRPTKILWVHSTGCQAGNGNQLPVANPYPHMGAPTRPCWPRGFPISHVKHSCHSQLLITSETELAPKPAILQVLANHDPDVDAIYRLTQPLPFSFESASTAALAFPPGLFVPFNAQATLVQPQAFWSLLLPVTVHGRVSDIWRSYAAQRLMWDFPDIGGLGFSPPRVAQYRNDHDFLADLDAEDWLYKRTGALLRFLSSWKPQESTLPARMEELYLRLYERGYIDRRDVRLMQQWIRTLLASKQCSFSRLVPSPTHLSESLAKSVAPIATATTRGLFAVNSRETPNPKTDSCKVLPQRRAVIGIVSAAKRRNLRDLIRATWLPLVRQRWNNSIEVRFMLDRPRQHLLAEASRYGDLVFINVPEGPHQFGTKLHAFYRWVSENYRADWVTKADDDTILCVPHYVECLGRLEAETTVRSMRGRWETGVVWGWFHEVHKLSEHGGARLARTQVRADEFFHTVSGNLAEWLGRQPMAFLPDTGYGGTSFSKWLRDVPGNRIQYVVDNQRFSTYQSSGDPNRILRHDFCHQHIVYHKALPANLKTYRIPDLAYAGPFKHQQHVWKIYTMQNPAAGS